MALLDEILVALSGGGSQGEERAPFYLRLTGLVNVPLVYFDSFQAVTCC